MDLRSYINSYPKTLTISPTHKCTAMCMECCFGCSPKIQHILDHKHIKKYIDQAMAQFPSIELFVLTGGECFLLGKKLSKIIAHATSYSLMTRVVTNGFWANTYDNALEKLSPIIKAGLTEINFSTGDNHQQYVKIENIINGTLAAYEQGIRSICISIESQPNASFTSEQIKSNASLSPLIDEGSLKIIDASWMPVKNKPADSLEADCRKIVMKGVTKQPCRHMFNNITINPYGQMLACCGLTVEYNKFLKLGSVEHFTMKELYDSQFKDFFKFWLFVDGPEYIYEKVMKYRKIPNDFFVHECAYCIELCKNPDNIIALNGILEKELPNILFRYKMRTSQLKI